MQIFFRIANSRWKPENKQPSVIDSESSRSSDLVWIVNRFSATSGYSVRGSKFGNDWQGSAVLVSYGEKARLSCSTLRPYWIEKLLFYPSSWDFGHVRWLRSRRRCLILGRPMRLAHRHHHVQTLRMNWNAQIHGNFFDHRPQSRSLMIY